MDNMNIQRPAVSSVDQRLDICDSMDAPTRPSLSTVEIDERDASVSWAPPADDDDGRRELLPVPASMASIGNVSMRSVLVDVVALKGDEWITLADDGDVR